MAWVYVLKCSDGSYYTGSTVDLEKRLYEHNDGRYDGYTAKRLPEKLEYCCEMATTHDASLRERQIKGWSRRKKEALISGEWEKLVEYSNAKLKTKE
ncbi:MAG: GIY-YIG nuclease family protein [Nitrospirae bacterium]|nr:GIY-YIG nuclease family protein [Nitrospirota bacterium]